MSRRHVIKKIVFEVEGSSQDAVAEIEPWLREIIHDIIIPKLGEYFDSLTSDDAVLYIDKIRLDLGPVQPGDSLGEIRSKVDSSFEKNGGLRIDRHSGEVSVTIADLEIILYFLRTGLMPWRASVHTRLPVMFENLLNTDPQAVESILRVVLEDPVAFQRLVWHISDELLFALFIRVPAQGPGWTVIGELKRMWDKSTTWGTLRNRRFHFWRIVINLLLQKRKGDFVKEFLAQWATVQNANIFSLIHLLERYSRKHQQELGKKPLFASLIPDSTRAGERMEILHKAVHSQMSRIGHELNMTGRTTVLLWQVRFLGVIARYLSSIPGQYQADLAGAMQQFLLSIPVKATDDIAEPWRPGGRTYQLDLKTIEPLLRDNLGPAYQAVKGTLGEFLGKQGRFGSADQFLFFLNKLEQVVQAFPPSSMKEALKEYVQRLKRKVSIQAQAMRKTLSNQVAALLRKLEDDLRRLPERQAQQAADLLETRLIRLMKSVPLSVLPSEKREPYKDLLLLIERSLAIPSSEAWDAACSGVKRMEQPQERINNRHDGKRTDHPEEDIYIRNAGLVLMAPFIAMMFEKLEYVLKGNFTGTGAVESALLLLQYCVSADITELQEYDLPLNKVLCGLDVTAPANLSRALSEEEKASAEYTIQTLLQEAPVFRNISPEGFRNAFLQREGVLRLYDQHAVLKVSRETFDIVLDKVPWSYQVIRFPWMKYPLMIEW